jgi:hypothetical protein
VGECECELVAGVPWDSMGAEWEREDASARRNVECARAVGEKRGGV